MTPTPKRSCPECGFGYTSSRALHRHTCPKRSLPDVFREIDQKRLELYPRLLDALELLAANNWFRTYYSKEYQEEIDALLREARGTK